MNLVAALAAFLLALVFVLVGVTRVGVWFVEGSYPAIGAFADVGDTRFHYVHLPAAGDADLPPVVFLHGASSNLRDTMIPVRDALEGRAELLFLDRPGHGWSSRGADADTPFGQARAIAGLMDRLGIARAIVVGHSLGGAVAAAFALERPDKVRGLVFLAPASHPWPGGGTSWYSTLAARPVIGRLFAHTLALPGGWFALEPGSACVFAPNALSQTYLSDAGIPLLLRPSNFRANAIDVAGLHAHTLAAAPRYGEIVAPAIIVTGDQDRVVYEDIHAAGLLRDLPNAGVVLVRNLGHKPDWVAPELTVAAIERLAGRDVDLQGLADQASARLAADAFNVGRCPLPARPDLGPDGPASLFSG